MYVCVQTVPCKSDGIFQWLDSLQFFGCLLTLDCLRKSQRKFCLSFWISCVKLRIVFQWCDSKAQTLQITHLSRNFLFAGVAQVSSFMRWTTIWQPSDLNHQELVWFAKKAVPSIMFISSSHFSLGLLKLQLSFDPYPVASYDSCCIVVTWLLTNWPSFFRVPFRECEDTVMYGDWSLRTHFQWTVSVVVDMVSHYTT